MWQPEITSYFEFNAGAVARGISVLVSVFSILIVMAGFTHARSDRTEIELPPLEPGQNELVIEDDREITETDRGLIEKCKAEIQHYGKQSGYNISGDPLITKSQKFGTIFRLDFEIPGIKIPGYFNRFVCWIRPDSKSIGYQHAFGQKGDPLP